MFVPGRCYPNITSLPKSVDFIKLRPCSLPAMLKIFSTGEHSSFLFLIFNDKRKKDFEALTTEANPKKLFTDLHNKLECLSLASLCSLVKFCR